MFAKCTLLHANGTVGFVRIGLVDARLLLEFGEFVEHLGIVAAVLQIVESHLSADRHKNAIVNLILGLQVT